MFGRGPRWGSKINIMFSFFRALFARTTCRFVVSLCQSTFYQPIFKMYKKKYFPGKEVHATFFFFITHVYKTLKRTKSSPALWNQHSVYTRYLIHWSLYKKKKNAQNLKKNPQKKHAIHCHVCSLSFLFIYIYHRPTIYSYNFSFHWNNNQQADSI